MTKTKTAAKFIDRRVIEVRREVLNSSDVWEKING
jgi:hypothetical protein